MSRPIDISNVRGKNESDENKNPVSCSDLRIQDTPTTTTIAIDNGSERECWH